MANARAVEEVSISGKTRKKTSVFWSTVPENEQFRNVQVPGVALDRFKDIKKDIQAQKYAQVVQKSKSDSAIMGARNDLLNVNKQGKVGHKFTAKKNDLLGKIKDVPNVLTGGVSSEQTANISTLSESINTRRASLKNLNIEDKKRVANLIKELAKTGEERELALEKLQEERVSFDEQLCAVHEEQTALKREREALKQRLEKSEKLLKKYESDLKSVKTEKEEQDKILKKKFQAQQQSTQTSPMIQSTSPDDRDWRFKAVGEQDGIKSQGTKKTLSTKAYITHGESNDGRRKWSTPQVPVYSNSLFDVKVSNVEQNSEAQKSISEEHQGSRVMETGSLHELYLREYSLQLRLQEQQIEIQRQQVQLQQQLQLLQQQQQGLQQQQQQQGLQQQQQQGLQQQPHVQHEEQHNNSQHQQKLFQSHKEHGEQHSYHRHPEQDTHQQQQYKEKHLNESHKHHALHLIEQQPQTLDQQSHDQKNCYDINGNLVQDHSHQEYFSESYSDTDNQPDDKYTRHLESHCGQYHNHTRRHATTKQHGYKHKSPCSIVQISHHKSELIPTEVYQHQRHHHTPKRTNTYHQKLTYDSKCGQGHKNGPPPNHCNHHHPDIGEEDNVVPLRYGRMKHLEESPYDTTIYQPISDRHYSTEPTVYTKHRPSSTSPPQVRTAQRGHVSSSELQRSRPPMSKDRSQDLLDDYIFNHQTTNKSNPGHEPRAGSDKHSTKRKIPRKGSDKIHVKAERNHFREKEDKHRTMSYATGNQQIQYEDENLDPGYSLYKPSPPQPAEEHGEHPGSLPRPSHSQYSRTRYRNSLVEIVEDLEVHSGSEERYSDVNEVFSTEELDYDSDEEESTVLDNIFFLKR